MGCTIQAQYLNRLRGQGVFYPMDPVIQDSPYLSIIRSRDNNIALMRFRQGQPEKAVEAFRRAITYHETADAEETAIASVHLSLGTVLNGMGQAAEAKAHFAQAATWFRRELEANPASVVDWDRLGETLAITGDFKGASAAFERAVALEPENVGYYQKLAKALEFQRRYDEGIAVVRRQIKRLEAQGQREAALQQRQYLEILEYEKAKRTLP